MKTSHSYSHFDRVFRIAAAHVVGLTVFCSACSSDDGPSDPIAKGQDAMSSRACGSCHVDPANNTLSGQTTPQPQTNAYPANLTPDSETGIGDWSEDQIVKAILTGIDDEDAHLCPPMPHFATEQGMTEQEARNIATYLKTLAPVKHAIPESSCPEKGDGAEGDGGAN